MNLANKILQSLSQISRSLPYHRKLNHFFYFLSKILLLIGAKPIVIANMMDGTSIKVNLTTRTEKKAFFTGKYDSDLIEIIQKLILPDSTFLDIGANIGFYSLSIGHFFKSNNYSGKVLSFEPFIGNFERLNENISTNKLRAICITKNFGLSNCSAKLDITLREDFKHGSSTGNAAIPTNKDFDKGFKTSPIQLHRLDDVFKDIVSKETKIDIIKMDIEGHEDLCLDGAQNTIKTHRPTILMEVAKAYYKARGVKLDDTFFPLIPEKYTCFYQKENRWTPLKSLENCIEIDNVFWVPNEKLHLKEYSIFKN